MKKKPEKMSTVGSIDLETKNIRNLNLFLQLYFAFRNINTSKCVVVLLIMVSGLFHDYGPLLFFSVRKNFASI